MNDKILLAYGISATASIHSFGHGLINNTWKIEDGKNKFILQKVNTSIFRHPEFISENIQAVAGYLSQRYKNYFFVTPCKTLDDKSLLFIEGEGYFRMFLFVPDSHTIDVAEHDSHAFEAARKFGELTKLLSHFPEHQLKITLPSFHDLSLRYKSFLHAIQSGTKDRIEEAAHLIQFLESQKSIVNEFERIKSSKNFKVRVCHHDTKINNVLFNSNEKGICVIDLDTLMPGYFISDVGDMIRTYTSTVNEEEKDVSKIRMREEYFVALAEGYLSEMHDELSEEEVSHFVFAGKFMIYMQALRFLTDYLNNDIYYGSAYKGHNLYRAANQAHLLTLLLQNENTFSSIVRDIVHKQAARSGYKVSR